MCFSPSNRNSDLFSRIMVQAMGGDYLANLKEDCGNKRVLGNTRCILHGAVQASERFYKSHNPVNMRG